ncbi:hypothetical protein EJ110_NYTH45820 [Nymphaea thermarum]|nr:hypothetical protein EJ110_NYTH45820 [Nymphaea thermarum]
MGTDLTGIAAQFETTQTKLMALNGTSNPTTLEAGQVLDIFLRGEPSRHRPSLPSSRRHAFVFSYFKVSIEPSPRRTKEGLDGASFSGGRGQIYLSHDELTGAGTEVQYPKKVQYIKAQRQGSSNYHL